MSRLKGTLIDTVAYAAGTEGQARQLDLSLGGQYGYQPDFGAYVSNTGYSPRNIIPLLIEAPRGFRLLPNPDKMVAVLKSLMETQSKQITGLRTGYTIESSERPIGGAGHMQSDLTNVTESMSTPTHVWDERYGKAIQRFWKYYVRMLMGDAATKQPGIMNLDGVTVEDHLVDFYSFTMLYIEPDPLRRHVVDAWMVSAMFPQTTGEHESQLDVTTGGDVPEVSIEFRGIPVMSEGVSEFAQGKLDELNYVNAGPQQRPAFINQISADIKAAENGYAEAISAASQTGI